MSSTKELVPPFVASLDAISDPAQDLIEVGIDAILKDGLFKEIPIVGTVVGLCKFGVNIRERNFLRQTIHFIKSFNDGSIKPEQLEKYRARFENDPKKAEEEISRVMLLLESHFDIIKSKYLAAFFRAYIKEAISWEKFCELSEANRSLFVSDYIILNTQYIGGLTSERELHKFDRLISLGLIERNMKPGEFIRATTFESQNDVFHITSFGQTFCQLTKGISFTQK